jgi:hypothetical protein
MSDGLPPNKAMKPTEQGQSCQDLFEAMEKRLVMCNQSRGSVSAITAIQPPRLIAGR